MEPVEYLNDYYTSTERYTTQPILPSVNNQHSENNVYGVPFWDTKRWKIRQDNISVKYWNNVLEKYVDTEYGGLWLVELWRPEESIKTRFGDMPDRYGSYSPTQESLENLDWVPCGEAVNLTSDSGVWKSFVDVEYTEGDTYLQRYDCLKTFGQNTDRQFPFRQMRRWRTFPHPDVRPWEYRWTFCWPCEVYVRWSDDSKQ